ncbi:DUF4124 domain-containing protein [Teredinibacter sp. KSP-S5-2]|uniref:DUF4124 domain-containing protein n=1 Tax=Teredinibacter sp. KSP-S5-2 TaxID=3034506 RepID=UPI00293526AB|nr:DUF4124 domain-containing protein [Teredinibacter sp. KSP-S5-2]WNO08788.1 DUF4124 domain-containing protein [Teredinibacter sp. KSP-S5-2]
MQNNQLFPRMLLISVALIMAHLSWADEVYKTVDDKGRVTYTDTPGANKQAKEVDLPPINTQPPVQYRPRTIQQGKAFIPETTMVLTSPTNGSQIGPTQDSITVAVEIKGDMPSYSHISISFSGQEYTLAKGAGAIEIPVKRIDRGEKTIIATMIGRQGEAVITSPPVTIHIIRPNRKPRASPKS